MGVSLSQVVEGQDIGLEDLFDKRIAIDAFNWIYQFLSIIRQPDGTPLQDSRGHITSHLSGLYYRTLKLLEANIKPIYVFDGKPPDFKKQTADQRRDARKEARQEWEKALERKDLEAARKYAQRSTTITEDIIQDGKKLLEAMGVPFVQAPNEGEALCSVMAQKGDVHAVSSQDYDTLLFGSPRLVRNLSISGKKKRGNDYVTVNPEIVLLKEVLDRLEISHDQLVMLGILVGTDYNPGGVSGYGPKKALLRVKEKKTLDKVFSDIVWDFSVSPEEIFEFFKNPKIVEYEIKFGNLDEKKIISVLCGEHDFSEERIESALKKLREKKKEQSSLSSWL